MAQLHYQLMLYPIFVGTLAACMTTGMIQTIGIMIAALSGLVMIVFVFRFALVHKEIELRHMAWKQLHRDRSPENAP